MNIGKIGMRTRHTAAICIVGSVLWGSSWAMAGVAVHAPAGKPDKPAPQAAATAAAAPVAPKPSLENAKKFIEINLSYPVTSFHLKFLDNCHLADQDAPYGVINFSTDVFLKGTLNNDPALFVNGVRCKDGGGSCRKDYNMVTRNSDLNERILKAVAVVQDSCIDRSLGF